MRVWMPVGIAVAVTLAFYRLVEWSQTNGIIGYYRDTLTSPAFAMWAVGLAAATIAAPICTTVFWLAARQVQRAWVFHILLVPVVLAIFNGAAALMFFAAREPDSDSLSGHALIPAGVLCILCPVAYYVGLGVIRIRRQRGSNTRD